MLSGRIGGVHAALALLCALASIVGSLGFINVARAPAVRAYGRLAVKPRGALRFWENLPSRKEVKDILALDFDGVVCDSAEEQARTAFRSVRRLWPQVTAFFSSVEDVPEWLLTVLRELRPVVETGYETILLVRMCIEQYLQASGSPAGINTKEIAATWQDKLRSALLQRYGVSAQELVDTFSNVREEWMATDKISWLAANRLFAGVDLPMGNCRRFEAYIITSKQARFVEAVLQARGLNFPRERIFGLGSGPTTDVLARLVRTQRERAQDDKSAEREAVIHFIGDRVETLEKVCADPRLQNVRLYMADWGYATPEQRQRALFNPRVRTIDNADLACFCRFMQYNTDDSFPCFPATVRNKRLTPERITFAPRVESEEGGAAASPPSEESSNV